MSRTEINKSPFRPVAPEEYGWLSKLLGLYRAYIGIIERKWKLLYYNRVYIGVIWVVVKILVPFRVPLIVRHLKI